MKEGEGVNQNTYVKDSWTWAIVWELTMNVVKGDRLDEGGTWDNCNSKNKTFSKDFKK